MAGTWRVALDRIEGVGHASLIDSAKTAFHRLNQREAHGFDDEILKSVLVEVSNSADDASVQRTKPFDLSEDGSARINRVLFVPAPAEGSCIIIRVLKPKSRHMLGEAQITEPNGAMHMDIIKKGRVRAVMHVSVTTGLPRSMSGASSIAGPSQLPVPALMQPGPAESLSPMQQGAQQRFPPSPAHSVKSAASGLLPTASQASNAGSLRQPPGSGVFSSMNSNNSRSQVPGSATFPSMSSAAAPSKDSIKQDSIRSGAEKFQSQGPGKVGTPVSAAFPFVNPPIVEDAAVAAVERAARASARARLPPGRRPLTRRPPNRDIIGTCDVTITEISGLESLVRPYLVIGLEGQEFDTMDVMGRNNPGYRRDGLRYNFYMGSVQSNLQIYVYQDVQGPSSVVGRILMPLTDILWPLGQVPDRHKLKAGFQKQEEPYRKDYVLQFMPPSIGGDGYGDPLFLDRFSPCYANMGNLGFGRITLNIEVEMNQANGSTSLLGFYANAVVLCSKAVTQQGDKGGPSFYKNKPSQSRPITLPDDGKEASPADALLRSTDFRSILRSLERLRHGAARPSLGLLAWLHKSPRNGMMAAVMWFVFCICGFFPCSLYMVPIYAWCLIAINGLLAASLRQQEWEVCKSNGDPVFWDDTACTAEAAVDGNSSTFILQCRKVLHETEHLMFANVACWERIKNALSFADGVASSAILAGLGVMALVFSFVLAVLKYMDPTLSFLCGMYGAMGLYTVSKSGGGGQKPKHPNPMWMSWAFNEALACVPDDAQMAHRFVATKVQCMQQADPGV